MILGEGWELVIMRGLEQEASRGLDSRDEGGLGASYYEMVGSK